MAETDKDNKQSGHSENWDRIIAFQQHLDEMEKQSLSKKNSSRKNSSADGSTLVAILCTVGGLVVMGVIFASLGVDAHNVPVILLIVLWIVFAVIIMAMLLSIGSKKR